MLRNESPRSSADIKDTNCSTAKKCWGLLTTIFSTWCSSWKGTGLSEPTGRVHHHPRSHAKGTDMARFSVKIRWYFVINWYVQAVCCLKPGLKLEPRLLDLGLHRLLCQKKMHLRVNGFGWILPEWSYHQNSDGIEICLNIPVQYKSSLPFPVPQHLVKLAARGACSASKVSKLMANPLDSCFDELADMGSDLLMQKLKQLQVVSTESQATSTSDSSYKTSAAPSSGWSKLRSAVLAVGCFKSTLKTRDDISLPSPQVRVVSLVYLGIDGICTWLMTLTYPTCMHALILHVPSMYSGWPCPCKGPVHGGVFNDEHRSVRCRIRCNAFVESLLVLHAGT